MKKQTAIRHDLAAVEMDGKRVTIATVRAKTIGISDEDIRNVLEKWKRERKIADKIAIEKAQKDVYRIEMTVEWSRGGVYGRQAQAEARVQYADGTSERLVGKKTGGCGYDKESTAISYLFNQFMVGMLWRKRIKKDQHREGYPYGCRVDKKGGAHYDYGVGTSCYRTIVEWLGGKWEHVSSGKLHDSWVITFPKNKPRR